MNAQVKAKWLEALRSGEYKQGTRRLYIGERYCCLGVLCDLHAQEKGKSWDLTPEGTPRSEGRAGGRFYLGECEVLPLPVTNWAGLTSTNPILYGIKSLSEYNDEGESFNKIADLIEQNL
jgi:hypothetical protein